MRSYHNATWSWITVNYTASQFSGVLPDLDIDSNYTVRVFAFNSKGESNGTFDLIYPDRLGMIFMSSVLHACAMDDIL